MLDEERILAMDGGRCFLSILIGKNCFQLPVGDPEHRALGMGEKKLRYIILTSMITPANILLP